MLKPFKANIGTDSTGRPIDAHVVWADEALKRIAELEAALRRCERLFNEALPKFDWGKSALDANAITLLNEVPLEVRAALDVSPRCRQ